MAEGMFDFGSLVKTAMAEDASEKARETSRKQQFDERIAFEQRQRYSSVANSLSQKLEAGRSGNPDDYRKLYNAASKPGHPFNTALVKSGMADTVLAPMYHPDVYNSQEASAAREEYKFQEDARILGEKRQHEMIAAADPVTQFLRKAEAATQEADDRIASRKLNDQSSNAIRAYGSEHYEGPVQSGDNYNYLDMAFRLPDGGNTKAKTEGFNFLKVSTNYFESLTDKTANQVKRMLYGSGEGDDYSAKYGFIKHLNGAFLDDKGHDSWSSHLDATGKKVFKSFDEARVYHIQALESLTYLIQGRVRGYHPGREFDMARQPTGTWEDGNDEASKELRTVISPFAVIAEQALLLQRKIQKEVDRGEHDSIISKGFDALIDRQVVPTLPGAGPDAPNLYPTPRY